MRRSLMSWLLPVLLVAACAEPPAKEMGQAQGAIDAARAAGGERYATDEFTAATTALQQANDAVSQRDYRLALNRALESREHAQNAARQAADSRARARGEAERTMAEVAGLMAQANSRVNTAERGKAPRRVVRDARQALSRVDDDVQKAGAAMNGDDYATAQTALMGVKERIAAVLRSLDEATGVAPARRAR